MKAHPGRSVRARVKGIAKVNGLGAALENLLTAAEFAESEGFSMAAQSIRDSAEILWDSYRRHFE